MNGVIAPFRATSLEAAAGKNPISHVGKLYNLLALDTARAIVEQVPEVRSATVYLLSQIGHPLDEPLVATAQLFSQDGALSSVVQAAVAKVIEEQLENIPQLRQRILCREISIC